MVIEGKTYDQLVFVRNMIPRCLRVPELLRMRPARSFRILYDDRTNEEQKSRLTKEMQSYRQINGGDTMTQKIYTEKLR